MAWQNAGGQQAGNMAEGNGVQAYTLQGTVRFTGGKDLAYNAQA